MKMTEFCCRTVGMAAFAWALISPVAWAQAPDDEPIFTEDVSIATYVEPPEAGTLSCSPNPIQFRNTTQCVYTPANGYSLLRFDAQNLFPSYYPLDVPGCRRNGNTCDAYAPYVGNASLKVVAARGAIYDVRVQYSYNYDDGVAIEPAVRCSADRVTEGGTVTCTAASKSYIFRWAGWGGDCSGMSTTCVLSDIRSAKTLVAYYVRETRIAAVANPEEGGTVTCTPNPVVVGGTASCLATPAAGYVFQGFEGDCSGAVCELTSVRWAAFVKANFSRISSIDARAEPPWGGSVQCTPAVVYVGDEVRCSATAALGYEYAGASGRCDALPCTFINRVGDRQIANFVRTAPLNDTGLDRCYDPNSSASGLCGSSVVGPNALFAQQDGRFGRDAQAVAGVLLKSGGGRAGFDWVKLARSGVTLPASAALGSGSEDWACLRDRVTGLDWLMKTRDGSDQDYRRNFTYAQAQDALLALNGSPMCGAQDWRFPSIQELMSIQDFGHPDGLVDKEWFPDIPLQVWTRHATSIGDQPAQRTFNFYKDDPRHYQSLRSLSMGVMFVRGAR